MQAGAIVRSSAIQTMQVGDGGHEREPEAGPGGALRPAGPVEALKDRRHLAGRDARPVVRDR